MALVLLPGLDAPGAPRVSVCIANYNGERLLADCIDSVLAQDTEAAIEILVHDDASSDRSVGLLRERYPQVQVLVSSENVGFCIANNRMVAAARGEFVLLLNNDAALQPDAIAVLLAEAERHATPCILTLPQYDWETGELVDRGCLLDPFFNPVPNLDPSRTDVAYVIGACLWCPRATWAELGGLPQWMGSIGEDLYFCCQARLRGYSVRVALASGYRHRQGASFGGNRAGGSGLSTTLRRRRLSERNKSSAMVVFSNPWVLSLLLPLHVALLLVEGTFVAVANRSFRPLTEVYLHTVSWIISRSGELRSIRRRLQAGRVIAWPRFYRAFVMVPRKLELLRAHGWPRVD